MEYLYVLPSHWSFFTKAFDPSCVVPTRLPLPPRQRMAYLLPDDGSPSSLLGEIVNMGFCVLVKMSFMGRVSLIDLCSTGQMLI